MHLVQAMAYSGDTPWHGIGNQLAPNQPIEVWARAAGMDWSNRTSEMEAAQSAVERAQRERDDARSNQTGVQQERARFAQEEKDALAQIDKTYNGITKATEVFQWYVRDDQVVPAWSGVELTKQDGSTARQDRNWQQTMWDLLNHREDDHVHAVLNISDNVVVGQ
ncbi:hypothetical protein EFP18_02635 [Burkholderia glumae]|uniref:hypothetical protein n=1 Tax=Burkholderia glumae TaxID=337 RepID=UPI000F5DB6F4|nr:hypothetical protein [Burkholderia glumae]RQZ65508.1 hypothetical protein DF052_26615 [Burkholderia glumae]UVS83166.1 hypothetical protein EFP18_02635 [Burkholderia glumae]